MAVVSRRRTVPQILFADCAVSDALGDVVIVSADEVAGVYQVSKINIDNSARELVFGLIVRKVTTTRCVVQTAGEVRGVYVGLTPGQMLFVDTGSRLSHTVPATPTTGIRLLHPAALALSSTALLLRVQHPIVMHPA